MSERFRVDASPLAGLFVVKRLPLSDSRGFLERMFCAEVFRGIGMRKSIVQINHTLTRQRGAVRGMHFQHPPHAETKIVSCVRGEVFDVAVDIRRTSPTFLQWHGEVLSAENAASLLIPEGFAHGFQCLAEDSEMLYFHTAAYAAQAEGGISPTDPRLAIDWPLPVAELSERDAGHARINDEFAGVSV